LHAVHCTCTRRCKRSYWHSAGSIRAPAHSHRRGTGLVCSCDDHSRDVQRRFGSLACRRPWSWCLHNVWSCIASIWICWVGFTIMSIRCESQNSKGQ
ncbi:hypothetical protein D0866_03595, partial [Hortaea werneckii]